jgi:hypothetical protein
MGMAGEILLGGGLHLLQQRRQLKASFRKINLKKVYGRFGL